MSLPMKIILLQNHLLKKEEEEEERRTMKEKILMKREDTDMDTVDPLLALNSKGITQRSRREKGIVIVTATHNYNSNNNCESCPLDSFQ